MNKILKLLVLLFVTNTVWAQIKVTGKISSASGPLQGASVTVKGSQVGTTTNELGMFSINVPSENSVLIFENIGYKNQEYPLKGNTNISVSLIEDISAMGEVVITASRQPVRKLESVTAVEVIGQRQLKAMKPEGIAEAVTNTPGLYVNTSQGRRGSIVTRGFPDGGNPLGGLDYTSILIDGLPAFGSTGRVPEAGFGFDNNVEKVEVVRGSAATLFGRAAAAGAINLISKTGGEKTKGSIRLTNYNNVFKSANGDLNTRLDFNINGSLSNDKKFRYNLGGWTLSDNGFKNTGFKDKGYQIRANVDAKLDDNKGNARIYIMKSDFVFQNLTDLPADITTMKPAGNWKGYQTMQNFNDFYNLKYTVYGRRKTTTSVIVPSAANGIGTDSIVRSVRKAFEDNSYGKAFQAGFNLNYNLGNGFTLDNKFRYQSMLSGTKYSFALPSFYRNNYVQRLLLDGDATDEDIINEVRISKSIKKEKVKHFIQGGYYHSKTNLKPTTYSFIHVMNPSDGQNVQFNTPFIPFSMFTPNSGLGPWTGPLGGQPRGSITRRAKYTEGVNAVFLGDEMKFNDKLTVNIGARYDWVWIGMEETKYPFDSTLSRNVKHQDWSGSLGFNYLLNRNSSIYGNINRSFRAPDYTAYTSLEWATTTNPINKNFLRVPNGISKNETIINTELGYRTSVNDFGIDVSGYFTKINNRLSRFFENGIVISRPFGENQIVGGEASVFYLPTGNLKGLSVRSSITYQKATFTKFKIAIDSATSPNANILGQNTGDLNVDVNGNLYGNVLINEGGPKKYSIDVAGNELPGIPTMIWNTSVAYNHKYFGLDLASNYNGARYVDATNILKYKPITIINAGAYLRLPTKGTNELKLGFQVKNLLDNQNIQNIAGLGANDILLGQLQKTPDWKTVNAIGTAPSVSPVGTPIWAQGYSQLPRRMLVYLSFEF